MPDGDDNVLHLRTPADAVAKAASPRVDIGEIGKPGLKIWGGVLREEFLPELIGTRGLRTIQEMRDNDPTIGAFMFAIENLAKQVSWQMQPSDANDPKAVEVADFVKDALFTDMNGTWQDVLGEILTLLPYGWAYLEVVYKLRKGERPGEAASSRFTDGKVGWRKWALRGQQSLEQWQLDEHGGIQALVQRPAPTYNVYTIPIDRSLLFRTTTQRNNPEGRSILRNCYRPWFFKRQIEAIEGIGIERDLAGYPVFRVKGAGEPGGPGPDVWNAKDATMVTLKGQLEEIIKSVRRDEQEGMVLPPWLEFSLVSTGSRRQFDTSGIITRYDQRIAMSVLADFVLLGADKVGSYALSSSKTHLFAVALGGYLDGVCGVVNRHAIPKLLRYNAIPVDLVPTLSHGDIETPDLAQLGAYVTSLAGAGAQLFPDPDLEAHLRTAAGLPASAEALTAKRFAALHGEMVGAIKELREKAAQMTRADTIEVKKIAHEVRLLGADLLKLQLGAPRDIESLVAVEGVSNAVKELAAEVAKSHTDERSWIRKVVERFIPGGGSAA